LEKSLQNNAIPDKEPKTPNKKTVDNGYRNMSKDEINNAANTNLLNFLNSIGEKVQQRGNNYFWIGGGNSSVAIIPDKPNVYKHFATGESGNAIKFCRNYLGMGFREAVEALNGGRIPYEAESASRPSCAPKQLMQTERRSFVPPVRDNGATADMLYGYLSDERGISKRVIWEFYDADSLYQTKEQSKTKGNTYSNIAFVAKDFEGNPQGAIKRSLTPDGFKGNHIGSNMKDFCFRHDGDGINGRLFVFEAPIDMLSFITIMEAKEVFVRKVGGQPDNDAKYGAVQWKEDSYLALGGVSPSPLLNYVTHKASRGQDIKEIWLALDHDKAGIAASAGMAEKLREIGYKGDICCYFPKNKDWNEDLQKARVHPEWRNGLWGQGFTDEHISINIYSGDDAALKADLEGLLGKHSQNSQQQAQPHQTEEQGHLKAQEPKHKLPEPEAVPVR